MSSFSSLPYRSVARFIGRLTSVVATCVVAACSLSIGEVQPDAANVAGAAGDGWDNGSNVTAGSGGESGNESSAIGGAGGEGPTLDCSQGDPCSVGVVVDGHCEYSYDAECVEEQTQAALADFYENKFPDGRASLPEIYVDALESFLSIEDRALLGEFEAARAELDALHERYPLSGPVWDIPSQQDSNIGSQPAYFALRMLEEVIRTGLAQPTNPPVRARMTVILVQCAEGTRPIDFPLSAPGEHVELTLDPRVSADHYRVLHQSLRLFRQYVWAITDGRLALDLGFEPIEWCGEVGFNEERRAGLIDENKAIDQVSADVRMKTDMWWIIYPSNVPPGPPFEREAFSTGGMGRYYTSPVFTVDDLWMIRHAPHLGQGEMYDVERRAYLPEWLMHEFFHHLYNTWPEFGLEQEVHQWFDRTTWPDDFVGVREADYHTESLNKRLRTATPPVHEALLSHPQPIPAELLPVFSKEDLVGNYTHRPVYEDDWYRVAISLSGEDLTWNNAAGARWSLSWQDGMLSTGPDSPYGIRPVQVLFAKGEGGTPELPVTGLVFFDGYYGRDVPP